MINLGEELRDQFPDYSTKHDNIAQTLPCYKQQHQLSPFIMKSSLLQAETRLNERS